MGLEHEIFYVLDVEGNGAQPAEIVELAITPITNLQIGPRHWEWLVQPSGPISAAATRIHGITDDDVAQAPTIEDIAGDIMTWTDGSNIIGHNVRVEYDILSRSIPGWRPAMAIDTLRLAKSVRSGLSSYSLESLGRTFNLTGTVETLTGKHHHSARFDTVMTALLFIELMNSLPALAREHALHAADILDNSQGTLLL